jgi:CheY-like chemotaxis protein
MRLERIDDFEVLTSDDSEQGCKLAATERPDIILMDLEMPDADSLEVVRRLKKDAQTGHIPIIGVSAYALDSERETAIAMAAPSSTPNLSSSSLWSPTFGASSRSRNNSPAPVVRTAGRPAGAR